MSVLNLLILKNCQSVLSFLILEEKNVLRLFVLDFKIFQKERVRDFSRSSEKVKLKIRALVARSWRL